MITRLQLSIGLLSAALLAFQIVLLQAFSTVQWYHFAYMVISVALVGFGASGTALTLGRNWFERHAPAVVLASMLLSGMLMPVSLALSQQPAARFDSYLLLTEASQIGSLVLTYVLLALPFFFGALALGLTFVRYTDRMGALYFANLVGSGAGGLVGLLLLYLSTPPALAGATGLIAVSGGLLLASHSHRAWQWLLMLATLAVALGFTLWPVSLQPSEYKDLDRALLMPDVEITSTRPHPLGTVQIAESPLFRQAPGLSLTYRGEVPPQDLVFVNRDMSRTLSGDTTGRLRDFTTSALPYVFSQPERVLILGGIRSGPVGQALASGAREIVVSEPHGGIYRAVGERRSGGRYAPLTDPRVSIRVEQPRSLLARIPEPFDLIVMDDVGSFGGTSGLFALQEQYDLTLQAVTRMFRRLSPDGALAVTAWMDYPPRNPLRMLATLVEMLEREGVAATDHLAAVRSWGTVTFTVTRRPIRHTDADSVLAWSNRLLFDPLVLPGLDTADMKIHNTLQDNTFLNAVDSLLEGNRSSLFGRYSFRLRPATDDRPYFSQFMKWSRAGALRDRFGEGQIPFFELGTLIVALTLLQISLLAIVLIVLPLARVGWTGSRRTWTVTYFGGIAAGFMFVELIMIQRFTLYFGHPVLAVAFVFSVLLVSSGLGSMYSSRLEPLTAPLTLTAGSVAAAIVTVTFLLVPLLTATIGLPAGSKLMVGTALLAPLSFLMGIPFPLGLRALGRIERSQVPWAWAINGSVSVASAPAAILMAAELGASIVLLVAAAAYGAVAVATRAVRRTG